MFYTYAVLEGIITGLAVGAGTVLPCTTAVGRETRVIPLATAVAGVIQRREGHRRRAQLAGTVGMRDGGAKVAWGELILPLAAAVAGLQS